MFEDLFSRNKKSTINLTKYIKGKLPFLIHVAGTNGKGSTCSYLEAVLMTKYKVGKFTSPHLISPLERISINCINISYDDFSKYYIKYKHLDISFFEFCFLIAINYFIDQKVDIAVIEVGIGGRLDITNILKYDISLITNVSLDHTQILGNTLDEIAYEKAGVAKNNTKCFYTDIILKDFVEKNTNDSKFLEKNNKFSLPLKGEFQKKNFALAYEVFKIFNFTDEEIKKGLCNFKLKARQEYIKDNILIDVSHNEDSIKALIENIKDLKDVHIHLSVLQDKDLKTIFELLSKTGFDISVYPLDNKRGRSIENIKNTLGDVNILENITVYKSKLNVFCGSFYFIEKVLKSLQL